MLLIWLVYHNIAILCENGVCNQVSIAHFNYLVGLGGLEIIFEIWQVIKIFKRKDITPDKSDMIITKKSHRKF